MNTCIQHKLVCLLILLSSLGGCASVTPKKEFAVVPVAVPCKTPTPEKPALHYAPGTYKDVFPVVRDLKGDREAMKAYEVLLEAALQSCK